MSDPDEIVFVTDGRIYASPLDSASGPFIVVFGELTKPVDARGRLTVPFQASLRRPDGSVVEVADAELDFAVEPESSGETDTVILRGAREIEVPSGSVITARHVE